MKTKLCIIAVAAILLMPLEACKKPQTAPVDSGESSSDVESISSDVLESLGGDTIGTGGTGESSDSTDSSNLLTKSPDGKSPVTTKTNKTVPPKKLDSGSIDTPQEKKFLSLKGKKVKIATEIPYSTYSDEVKSFYAGMEKKYGVTFEFVTMSGSEQQTKIAQLVASGDAPDLCYVSYVLFLRYVYGNVIQSMEPYIDKTDPIWKVNSWTLSMYDFGGSLYALPYANSPGAYMVYYNKTLFEENNKKTPIQYYNEKKWNFDTFFECAKNMTLYREDGVTTKTFGCKVPVQMVFCLANGEPGVSVDKNGDLKVTLDSNAGMSGLKLLSDLYAGGYCGDGDFQQRKVAMAIDRPEYLIYNNDLYNSMEDEIGMAPMPKGTTGTYYCPMGNDGFAIPKNCKNPLGGMMVIYESYVDNQNQYYDTLANGATKERVEARRKIMSDEHMKIYKEYVSSAKPSFTNLESLAGWWDAGYKGDFWRSIEAGKSPASAIDSMKSVLNSAIKRTAG